MMKADKFLNTLTLDERKQIFSPNNYSNNLTIKNRLEEWNKVKSLVSDKYFEERLDIENITKQEFGCLLKDPVESKDEVIKYD